MSELLNEISFVYPFEMWDSTTQQPRWVLCVRTRWAFPFPVSLCQCHDGHATRREALWCDEARALMRKYNCLNTPEDIRRMMREEYPNYHPRPIPNPAPEKGTQAA